MMFAIISSFAKKRIVLCSATTQVKVLYQILISFADTKYLQLRVGEHG